MTVSLTPSATNIELGVSNASSISTVGGGGSGVQVWLTEGGGGARTVQVPAGALLGLSWTDRLDGASSASVTLDRLWLLDDEDPDSWLLAEVSRVETEVQIVHEGRVVFWGPVLSINRSPGAASVELACAGCEWFMGSRLVPVDEPVWSREWLANPGFTDGLDGWDRIGSAPTWDATGGETSGPAVEFDTTGQLRQSVLFGLSPEWQVLIRARVFVPAAVPADEVLVLAECASLAFHTSRRVTAGEVTRDQWTWASLLVTMRGEMPPGTFLDVTLAGDSTETAVVVMDSVSMQVSAESLGIPGQPPRARFLTQRLAFQSVINAAMTGFGIVPSTTLEGRTINAPWAARGDVFVSEAVRQLVDAEDGIEWGMVLTSSARVALMTDRWGVEHDPGDLTLSVADATLVAARSWESGVDQPVSEWIVQDEDGFTGSFTDETLFPSLPPLQQFVQAPTGTAVTELDQRAAKLASDAGSSYTEQWSLEVPVALASTLGVGDRVQLTIDDGPDQWDDLVRVLSRTVDPFAAAMKVTAARWEA